MGRENEKGWRSWNYIHKSMTFVCTSQISFHREKKIKKIIFLRHQHKSDNFVSVLWHFIPVISSVKTFIRPPHNTHHVQSFSLVFKLNHRDWTFFFLFDDGHLRLKRTLFILPSSYVTFLPHSHSCRFTKKVTLATPGRVKFFAGISLKSVSHCEIHPSVNF